MPHLDSATSINQLISRNVNYYRKKTLEEAERCYSIKLVPTMLLSLNELIIEKKMSQKVVTKLKQNHVSHVHRCLPLSVT